MLKFSQYCKSDKAPFIIYADLESLIAKIDGCKNNPEKLSATKLSDHITSGFSMSTMPSFKAQKISIMDAEVQIYEKNLRIFKKAYSENN